MGDEGVLRGVHDERAVRHVLADAQERQKPDERGEVRIWSKELGERKFLG